MNPSAAGRGTGRPKVGGEVPHRREEEGRPRLAAPDVGGFFGDLGHPDGVALRVGVVGSSPRRSTSA